MQVCFCRVHHWSGFVWVGKRASGKGPYADVNYFSQCSDMVYIRSAAGQSTRGSHLQCFSTLRGMQATHEHYRMDLLDQTWTWHKKRREYISPLTFTFSRNPERTQERRKTCTSAKKANKHAAIHLIHLVPLISICTWTHKRHTRLKACRY